MENIVPQVEQTLLQLKEDWTELLYNQDIRGKLGKKRAKYSVQVREKAAKVESDIQELTSDLIEPLKSFIFSLSQISFFKSQSETFNQINKQIATAESILNEYSDKKDSFLLEQVEEDVWTYDLD